jgi:ADP-ribose pyrophosphatase YjhB (NUDIX family)
MVTDTAAVPNVLDWAQRLQAIAQTGLAYEEPTEHDRHRYEQVRKVAAEMLARGNRLAEADLIRVFASQTGHATPKLDVRGVVFREEEILLVRERVDRRWTLPGGWADVGEGPSEAVTREVLEESGYRTRAVKLLALYDRDRHGHPPHPWHAWKAVFLCQSIEEEPRALGSETIAAGFFPRKQLPELSLSRVTPQQLARFFEHREHPEWPTDFD